MNRNDCGFHLKDLMDKSSFLFYSGVNIIDNQVFM